MIAALSATLAHPRWWVLALAAFLVRGGVLVLTLPILALPTLPDAAASLGTTVAYVALGPAWLAPALGALAVVGLALLTVALGAVGAVFEQGLVAAAAADEELDGEIAWPAGAAAPRVAGPLPALAVRLVAHVPTAVALGWSAVRLGNAAADELLRPSAPGTTVVGRVVAAAPEAVVAPVVIWLVAELVAGVAVRRLDGRRPAGFGTLLGAVALAGADVVRRPAVWLAWLAGTAALVAAIAPTWLALAIAYDRIGAAASASGSGVAGPALVALVASWFAGLGLVAVAAAWRSVAMTVAVAGTRPRG